MTTNKSAFPTVFVSPMDLSWIYCPICPGLTLESVFHSLVLGLYGTYGRVVVNVEEPASILTLPAESSCFKQKKQGLLGE